MYKKIAFISLTVNISLYSMEQPSSKAAIDQNIIIDSPLAEESRAPKFTGLDASFLKNRLDESSIQTYKKYIEQLNPGQNTLWKRKLWDIDYYKDKNLPIIVGTLQQTQAFSSKYQDKGLRFLDLPIYMPGQGWQIPKELEQFKEVIKMAVDHERLCVPNFEKDHYVYITVDQGITQPHTSQRRAGWHGDSYRKINSKQKSINILVDHVYVVYDNCPTLFVEGPFPLDTINPEDITAVLEQFERIAKNKKQITYPPYTLLRLDPYCIHDAGINTSNTPFYRTFVKISFSKIKYIHLGNAHNNLFKYDWPFVPRKGVPYTQEAMVLSAHRKDRDQFQEIDPTEIDFLRKKSDVPWASSLVNTVIKVGQVYAEPARVGELLETKSGDNFTVTINVAQKGDYKVMFASNDWSFLSSDKIHELFSPDPNRKNWFSPKKALRRAVKLTKAVRMKGPWGTIHYAAPDDYLVYIHEDDCYFVPKSTFEEQYEILD